MLCLGITFVSSAWKTPITGEWAAIEGGASMEARWRGGRVNEWASLLLASALRRGIGYGEGKLDRVHSTSNTRTP